MENKDNQPFGGGDIVYLNSAPERLLTVEHCVWNYMNDNKWWVFMIYWDEPTKKFTRYNTYSYMLTKFNPSLPEEPKSVGYKPS